MSPLFPSGFGAILNDALWSLAPLARRDPQEDNVQQMIEPSPQVETTVAPVGQPHPPRSSYHRLFRENSPI